MRHFKLEVGDQVWTEADLRYPDNDETCLEDNFLRDEDDHFLVLLKDNKILDLGIVYPTKIHYGLDEPFDESVTMIGNNKEWS